MRMEISRMRKLKNVLMIFAVIVSVALPAYSFAVNTTSTFSGTIPSASSSFSTVTTQEDTCTARFYMYHEGTTSPLVDTINMSYRTVGIGSWGYGTGTYTTAQGYYGNIYAVGSTVAGVFKIWGMLDDNAPGNTTGGNLNSYKGVILGAGGGGFLPFNKFYMTYVNGGYAHGHFDLVPDPSNNCTANPQQSRTLEVAQIPSPTFILNWIGYFPGTLYPDLTLLYFPALNEGIHIGMYTDSLSNPTGTFDFHQFISCAGGTCYANGVSEGMVFGTLESTITGSTVSGNAEQALAVAGSGSVTVNPIPGVSVTGDIGYQNIITAVQTTAVNLSQPNFQIASNGSTAILVYDISVSGPSTMQPPVTICLNYDPYPYDPTWQIWHESPLNSGSFTALTTIHNPTDHTLCAQTPSFSLFAVGYPLSTSPAPVANFSWTTDPTTSFKINFTASGCPDSHTCTYDWDFGDGDIETGGTATTSHTYADSSVMTVSLVIMDSTFGMASAPTSKQVLPDSRNAAPAASFNISVSGWTVTVTDTSIDDAAFPVNAVKVQWGDGASAVGNAGGAVSHTYARQGSYIVKMSITDAGGKKVYAGNAQAIVPTKFKISGKAVRLDATTPVSSVSIRLMKGTSVVKMAATQADGTYILNDVLPDVYMVRAVKSGLSFVDQPTNASAGNVTNVNFTANR